MQLVIFTRDDETGVLDGEFRDGDISRVYPDSTDVGNMTKKTKLVVIVEDPPNFERWQSEMVTPEYLAGATPQDESPMKFKRKYRVDWRAKFTLAEIAIIKDVSQILPDGETDQGGVVVSGVVSNLFTLQDVIRK